MEVQHLETIVQPETEPWAQQEQVDTLYQESLVHFQNGQWQEAMAGFQEVLRLHPDHAEAQAFLEETRLKASLDQDKPKPKHLRFQGPIRRLVLILAALSTILFVAAGLQWAYGRWVKPVKASQQIEIRKAQQLEQAYRYLAERDYAAAEEAFRTLLAADPSNQEAQKGLAEVQKKAAIAQSYAQAQQAIARQDWNEALRLLTAVMAQDPGYKDVQAQQGFVQEQQTLSTWFDKAEKAYRAGDWQEAISCYETLRSLDAEYQKQSVIAHLFDSYLQQGVHLVESTKGNNESVQEAQELYQKALALQPQEPQAMQEMALADKYLEGQRRLGEGDKEGAITALEWVYQQQPGYAGGNAAALLKLAGGMSSIVTPTVTSGSPISPTFTSTSTVVQAGFQAQYANWMQKGDAAMGVGDYAQAEGHYHEATAVAVHGGYDSARWLFVSYVKLGGASARNGKYEQAVQQTKTAIQIMTKSASAIPASSYSDYIEQGDRYAQNKDYQKALAQYEKAVQVLGQKCNCGLEDWSILP